MVNLNLRWNHYWQIRDRRFVASKFEEIFKNHAKTYPDALTEEELKALLMGNREPKNYVGWLVFL